MPKTIDLEALKQKAVEIRREILETIETAGSGHPGGSLSAVEIFLTLYGYQINHKPSDPHWEDRDRVIVSKGHVSPVVYVTLANFGYFPKEELKTFRKFGARLQGHVVTKVPGVEFNTGSLGHGLSFSNGITLGARMRGKDFRVYCVMGDGELQEGSVWEAAMTAAHHKLDHVCAIVDCNKVQENGLTHDIKNLEPLAQKWAAFGWHTIEIDGNSIEALIAAFDEFSTVSAKPTVIIANTIKGKGVSFMEGKSAWHGKAPNKEQLAAALKELQRAGEDMQRKADIERKSKETQIKVSLNVDGTGKTKIKTPIGFLDHMLELFAFHGYFDLDLSVTGDTHIDIHHTNEDIGIALGKVFKKALGEEKAGIKRFGSAFAPMESTVGHCVIDISGRGYFSFNTEGHGKVAVSAIKDQEGYKFSYFMHFMESFAHQLGATLNFTLYNTDDDLHTNLETMFKSLGLALDQATTIDPRREGQVPSTKGIID